MIERDSRVMVCLLWGFLPRSEQLVSIVAPGFFAAACIGPPAAVPVTNLVSIGPSVSTSFSCHSRRGHLSTSIQFKLQSVCQPETADSGRRSESGIPPESLDTIASSPRTHDPICRRRPQGGVDPYTRAALASHRHPPPLDS